MTRIKFFLFILYFRSQRSAFRYYSDNSGYKIVYKDSSWSRIMEFEKLIIFLLMCLLFGIIMLFPLYWGKINTFMHFMVFLGILQALGTWAGTLGQKGNKRRKWRNIKEALSLPRTLKIWWRKCTILVKF